MQRRLAGGYLAANSPNAELGFSEWVLASDTLLGAWTMAVFRSLSHRGSIRVIGIPHDKPACPAAY